MPTLLHFSRHGALPVTRAGARLQVQPTSVTNAVDRLEAAGPVRHGSHPTDRRAALVEITGRGSMSALAATAELDDSVFARPGLPPRRVTARVAVLKELPRRAGDLLP